MIIKMVNVAILGFGVVGSGVAEVLKKNAESIAQKAGMPIRVKYILDLRDFPGSPYENLIVKDFSVIENDPEVQVVAECIGGKGVARDFTKRALMAGKHVVTSNKELVAEHGYELIQIAKQKNLNYLFEASVGGGIPIIRPLTQCLTANELTEIRGILNGTTNYILTKMIKDGLTFETALSQAQKNGYAESDPTADVEGYDACRKICILSNLSFGRHVMPSQVPTEGITGITTEDVRYAEAAGKRIKLLGRSLKAADGKIYAYVAPHMLSNENQLSNVEDVFNAIVVMGDAIGDVMFYGRGAGKLPTASAVVADIIDSVKHFDSRKYLDWEEGGPDVVGNVDTMEMTWYVRTKQSVETAASAFGEIRIIDSVQDETAFFTEPMSRGALNKCAQACPVLATMRVLD